MGGQMTEAARAGDAILALTRQRDELRDQVDQLRARAKDLEGQLEEVSGRLAEVTLGPNEQELHRRWNKMEAAIDVEISKYSGKPTPSALTRLKARIRELRV